MRVIADLSRLDLSEMKYYNTSLYFLFLFQLYNQRFIKPGEQVSVNIPPEYNDTDFPDIVKIVSLEIEYEEVEGEYDIIFVVKVAENTFKQFIIHMSSWNGLEHKGPFTVYPENKIVYVRKGE